MYLERIDIDRFGGLESTTIGQLDRGVHVFHGTNETGKTTLLEFVRAMLFGFESLFERGVIDAELPCGGRLLVRPSRDDAAWSLTRRHLPGEVESELVIEDGQQQAAHRSRLREWTGGIDEASYVAVMAFGLDELHELSTLQAAGCGSRLYELAGGLDRSSVFRLVDDLRDAVARIDAADPTESPLAALFERRRKVLGRIEAAASPAVVAGRRAAERRLLEEEIARREPALAEATREEELLLQAIDMEPLRRERLEADEALAAFEGEELLHEDFHRWRRLNRRRLRHERRVAIDRDARRRWSREGKAATAPSAAWSRRTSISLLLDEEPRIERLTGELARAEAEATRAARRFGEAVGSVGLATLLGGDQAAGADSTAAGLPPGFARSFAPLAAAAKACRRAARGVAAARRDLAEIEDSLATFGSRGDEARPARIAELLEEASATETMIRNRLAAAGQLEEVDRGITTLEGEVRARLEDRLLPAGWLAGLGTAFAGGTGLLLSGLLLPAEVTGSLAYAMAAVGLTGAGIAGGTTWSLDRAKAGRLADARRRLSTAERQRDGLAATVHELDARLGNDPLPLTARLEAVQEQIRGLAAEASEAGESERREGVAAEARQRLEQAIALRKRARSRWRKSLALRGFPTTLDPRGFAELAEHRQQLRELDEARRHAAEVARLLREDLTAIAAPVEEAAAALELSDADGRTGGDLSPLDAVRLLRERLTADRKTVRRRKFLARKYRRARLRHRISQRRLSTTNRRIASLWRLWEAEGEEAFLAKVDRRAAQADAVHRLELADIALREARGAVAQSDLPTIDHWLDEARSRPLEPLAREAARQRDAHAAALAEAREKLAAVGLLLDAARDDHGLEPLQEEIAEIDCDIAAHRHRREALLRAVELLIAARRRYMQEHQPPVLAEASLWLQRLTDGSYLRITADGDEAYLRVHDDDGAAWRPERLSRGTREQVFLALRLALVADLERSGVKLPIIMDDALVNFDDTRARAAARVLVEFGSQGERQLLVLTCHAHVAALFREAAADVRSLGGVLPPPRPAAEPLPPAPRPPRVPPPPLLPAAGPGDGIPELPGGWAGSRPARAATVEQAETTAHVEQAETTAYVARHRWTAEEFSGELEDRVAVRTLPMVNIPPAMFRPPHAAGRRRSSRR